MRPGSRRKLVVGALAASAWAGSAHADTLSVGPGQTHAAPCAALTVAADGDVIEIDAAGSYEGDVCAITANDLTIRGVNGRASIDAAGNDAQGKAIWVIQGNDTVVEDIEFTGAAVADGNGAGIRQEGVNLTVRRCAFRDNQDGILAGDSPDSEILIEYSEFDHNGAGDGYTHNLYVNHVGKLTFRFNWSHRAQVGHLLKSRAAENHILYNRLTGESDGTESYEIDLPNGGLSYVIGNLIEQGANTDNPNLLSYMAEGAADQNPSHALFVVNNTFVNDLGSGTFVSVGDAATTPVVLRNNVFFGGGTITNQAGAVLENNYDGSESCFIDVATLDVALLAGSPCVDTGADPGSDGDFSLLPVFHYVHPTESETRGALGGIDLGAYELGGGELGGSAGDGTAGNSSSAGSSNGGTSSGATNGGGVTNSGGATNGGGGASSGAGPGSGAASNADEGCACRIRSTSNISTGWLGVAIALAMALRRRARSF
jgi:hypothetical protein